MKKIISILISIVFICTFSVTAFASSYSEDDLIVINSNITMEKGNNLVIIRQQKDDKTIIATNNLVSGIMKIETIDKASGDIIERQILDINQLKTDVTIEYAIQDFIKSSPYVTNSEKINEYNSTHSYQRTFSNIDYDIYLDYLPDMKIWNIRYRYFIKTTVGDTSNLGYLESFKSEVENTTESESDLIADKGEETAKLVISALCRGGLAAGLAVLASGSGVASNAAVELNDIYDDAQYYYNKIN